MPVFAELGSFFRASLLDPVQVNESPAPGEIRRRRIVVGITLVVGAIALGSALAIKPGDPWFYPATLGVAAIWVAARSRPDHCVWAGPAPDPAVPAGRSCRLSFSAACCSPCFWPAP